MGPNGNESGVVQGQSDQKSETKIRRRMGENIESLLLQRIWNYKEKIFDKKKNKETDKMMTNILRRANAEWREQRSVCAKILDPRNQDKMKRRRAGVVHTNWDHLWTKWNGNQRWWEGLGDWKSFKKTAEELCRRTLIKDMDKKREGFRVEETGSVQTKDEKKRRESEMKEKEKQRIWDPAWGIKSGFRFWETQS